MDLNLITECELRITKSNPLHIDSWICVHSLVYSKEYDCILVIVCGTDIYKIQ